MPNATSRSRMTIRLSDLLRRCPERPSLSADDARLLSEGPAVDLEGDRVLAERRELIDDARGVAAAGASASRARPGATRTGAGPAAASRDSDIAGAAPAASPGAGRARRPYHRIDPGRRTTLEPRDLLAAAVGDDDGRVAGGRPFQVVANQDAVRFVGGLEVALAKQIVVGAELPRHPLHGRPDREEVRVLREDLRVQFLQRADVRDPEV